MKVTFQYPVFDCRTLFKFKETTGFLSLGNSRYDLSVKKFMKNTGPSAPVDSQHGIPSAQQQFFFARRALQLPNLSASGFVSGELTFTPQVHHRIFVPFNDFISYYEVSFFDKLQGKNTITDSDRLKQVISYYCKTALTVPMNSEAKADALLQQPQSPLSALFYYSTTPESVTRAIRNILKGEVKKTEYSTYDAYMQKNIRSGTPVAVFEIDGTEKLGNQFKQICRFNEENVTIYRLEIKDRIDVWIIARQNRKESADLVSEIKMYILSIHRLSQSIKTIVRFISKSNDSIHNKITRDKILESITDDLVADRYFNRSHNYDEQQFKIRESIIGLNEEEAKKLILKIDQLDQLKLTRNTLYLLFNKDFILNNLITFINTNLGYKNLCWFTEFRNELEKGNYKACLKLTVLHREIAGALIGQIKKTAGG